MLAYRWNRMEKTTFVGAQAVPALDPGRKEVDL